MKNFIYSLLFLLPINFVAQSYQLAAFTETFVPLNSAARENTTTNTAKPKAGTVTLVGKNRYDTYFKVYPNPTNGQFYVEYALEDMQTGNFVLTDLLGKEILRKPLQNNKGKLEVKEQLNPGIYLYQIIVNNEVFDSNKIVITQQ